MRLATWVVGAVVVLAAGARAEEGGVSAQVKVHDIEVGVRASSALKDAKTADRYSPAHLLDNDPATLWAEGSAGEGVGEWVELSFPPGTSVDAFLVTPGNTRSAALYRANARPRKMRLELKYVEDEHYDYTLEFPRDAPVGSALYVLHRTPWTLKAARLTVLSVWPGSKYRDLCLGTFVPVFKGPDKSFLGQGQELAPTLSLFMHRTLFTDEFLPTDTIDEPVWLRFYAEVPHEGPLPKSVEKSDLRELPLDSWGGERRNLEDDVDTAVLTSYLFRLTPAAVSKGYVFDPAISPRSTDESGNFRLRWRMFKEQWRLVEINMKYREPVP